MKEMDAVRSSWLGNFDDRDSQSRKGDDDLLVFGYSCKLFRDDERALCVDQGKFLIPWMGDENHKIDRYDVRGYLNDLGTHEATNNSDYLQDLNDEERRIEQLCEEERYSALFQSISEEDTYHEEELKRLKAALAEDGSYHEIGFTYKEQEPISEEVTKSPEEPVEESFKLPPDLTVPSGMSIPEVMKVHLIIEKTAAFVAQHGPQMEIVIKNKQASNPQFQFLVFENELNPYFKHLVSSIKTGRYTPKPCEEKGQSDSEDDDDYLHPSLFAAQSSSPVKIPDLPVFKAGPNDAYAKLVQNLKDKVVKPQSPNVPGSNNYVGPGMPNYPNNWTTLQGNYANSSQGMVYGQPPPPGDEALYHAFSNSLGSDLRPDQVVTPPLEVQSIVDKMAEYVVRSGDDFEAVVRRKQDKRFEFLNPDNQYHAYYIYKKTIFAEQKRIEAQQKMYEEAEREKRERQLSLAAKNQYIPKESTGPVSFSLKMKDADVKDVKLAPLAADSDDENNKLVSTAVLPVKIEVSRALVPTSLTVPRKSMFDVPPTPAAFDIKKIEELALKKITSEAIGAKIAEEKLRDRLAAAARDKMAQQTRERLLQQERKRKAALFLNMIKSTPSIAKSTTGVQPTASVDACGSSKKQVVFGPHLENNSSDVEVTSENGRKKISTSSNKSSSPLATMKDSSRSSRGHSRSYERNSPSPPSSHKSHLPHHQSDSHRRKSFHSKGTHERSSKHKTLSTYSSSRRSRSRSISPKRSKGRSKSRDKSRR